MIGSLRGIVLEKTLNDVLVDCNGVGYEVRVSVRTLASVPAVGQEVTLRIHTIVREDALDLYGFASSAERELFRRLIQVAGVGAALATAALSTLAPEQIQLALMQGDEKALSRIPGVGRKLAQRLILELGEKIGKVQLDLHEPTPEPSSSTAGVRAIQDLELALEGLGFARRDYEPVVRELQRDAGEGTSAEQLLRRALAALRAG